MDETTKFIIDISNQIEPFFYDINWKFFEEKFDLENFSVNNNGEYIDSVDWVITNAFNENPLECIRMTEYICYKYNIEFDFSKILEEINLNNKNNAIEFPQSNIESLRVFISYSSEDFEEANRIYKIFKEADISCFYANEEIKVGEKWNDRIFEELISADIFIFLISENFKKSFWCNQESSIGYLKFELDDSIIIPLLLDNVKPYGILYNIQGKPLKNFRTIEDFAELIDSEAISFESAIEHVNEKKLTELNNEIEKLRHSSSFYESNEILKKLKRKNLNLEQAQKIIDYAILNDQVLRCFEFNNIIKRYLRKFKNELDESSVKKLNELMVK